MIRLTIQNVSEVELITGPRNMTLRTLVDSCTKHPKLWSTYDLILKGEHSGLYKVIE